MEEGQEGELVSFDVNIDTESVSSSGAFRVSKCNWQGYSVVTVSSRNIMCPPRLSRFINGLLSVICQCHFGGSNWQD